MWIQLKIKFILKTIYGKFTVGVLSESRKMCKTNVLQ